MLYQAIRDGKTNPVTVGDEKLPRRTEVYRHADTFDWSHGGPEAAQLALALLYHHLTHEAPDGGRTPMGSAKTTAIRLHAAYKWSVVCRLPLEGWTLDGSEIQEWIERQLQTGPLHETRTIAQP